jgi:cytidylate kinase
LIDKGESVNLAALLEDIRTRDRRDSERAVAPLKPALDAVIVDSTALGVEQVFQHALELLRERNLI